MTDNVNIILFDISTYIVPGGLVISSVLILLSPSICTLIDIQSVVNNVGFNTGVIFLFVSYIVGFVFYHFVRVGPNRVVEKCINKKTNNEEESIDASVNYWNVKISKPTC